MGALGILSVAEQCAAQEESRDSLAAEAVAEARARAEVPDRYNIRWGAAGLNFSAGLRGEYVDNVYLTDSEEQDDFILIPQLDAGAFFPIGQLNALAFDVGLAYYHYFENTELNTHRPLVNPNSELAFNIYSGDVAIRLSEAFSYQETPFHEYGGQFYNVYDTGRFSRYLNRIGGTVRWDLHDLIVDGGYHHENFFSRESAYDDSDRASELFNAGAMFSVLPFLSAGLEGTGGFNRYENEPLNDHWRATVGPALELEPTQFVKVRLGGGYQRIDYDSEGGAFELAAEDTFYAYMAIEHEINRFINHGLRVAHDNQIGINAPNIEGNHLTYWLTWKATEHLRVSPYAGYHAYEESYGTAEGTLYDETFDYFLAGIGAEHQFTQNWLASLRYDFRRKDSDTETYGYTQNRVALTITYRF